MSPSFRRPCGVAVGRTGVVVLAVPCSMTVATISIDPFEGTVSAVANSVITLPVGASSGTLSQEEEDKRDGKAGENGEQPCRRGGRYVERVVVAYSSLTILLSWV